MTETLTITDNRTGQTYELPITDNTIKAADLKQITAGDLPGISTYDPGLVNTSACRSSVTYIDGDAGILEYRGYPIEQLAEECTYLEVAYLLIHGKLPNPEQLAAWNDDIRGHRFIHENVKALTEKARHDAHPMATMMAAVAGLHTFYPSGRKYDDEDSRALQVRRLIAKMPTIAAFAYRHSLGLPYVYPSDELCFTENFLAMLFRMGESDYRADPRLVRALEVLFILHADHEQNCSTTAVRTVASAGNDPYTSVSAGIGALFGPLHGGANEAVLRMLDRIGDHSNIGTFIDGVKAGKEKLIRRACASAAAAIP